jgi:hypothetical protein
MKTCPSCRKTYEDESQVFCLDDGAILERAGASFDSNATWNLPPPGPTVASPRPTPPTAQSTIRSRPEQFQMAAPQVSADGTRGESRRGAWPWVFGIVLVLGASGVLIAWIMTRGSAGDTSGKYPAPTPPNITASPSPIATAKTNERASATPNRPTKEIDQPTPTPSRPKPMFAVLNNISFNGSRITYYQRTSFALCQADCAGNANCKGLTWIRPGAYNPSDPGMCYLMSAVTQRVPHTCCISAVKN